MMDVTGKRMNKKERAKERREKRHEEISRLRTIPYSDHQRLGVMEARRGRIWRPMYPSQPMYPPPFQGHFPQQWSNQPMMYPPYNPNPMCPPPQMSFRPTPNQPMNHPTGYFTNFLGQSGSEFELEPARGSDSNKGKKKVTRKHVRKGDDEEREERGYEFWSVDEELDLTQAWIATMEDPKAELWIKTRVWWEHCYENWCEIREKEKKKIIRVKETLQAHWKHINDACKIFGNILKSVDAGWQSGMNDQQINTIALSKYQQTTGKAFKFLRCYEMVKVCPNWPREIFPRRISGASRTPAASTNRAASSQGSANFISDAQEDENAVDLGDDDFVQPKPHTPQARRRNNGKETVSSSTVPLEDLGLLMGRYKTTTTQVMNMLNEVAEKERRANQLNEINIMGEHIKELREAGKKKAVDKLEKKYFAALTKYYELSDEDDEE